MAYYDIALLSSDSDFLSRAAAAYATETLDDADAENASSWAFANQWELAAQPGFGDAYASALAGGVDNPGRDPGVITDPQILSSVQAMVAP